MLCLPRRDCGHPGEVASPPTGRDGACPISGSGKIEGGRIQGSYQGIALAMPKVSKSSAGAVEMETPPLFLEYEDVLKRPEHRLAHGLTPEAIDEFLAELAALIEPVEVHFQWRPQSRDPNDEMVLEAAINGRAHALVTYNVADFAHAAERFRISVLRPAELLKKVRLR
jgi:predicted nucleic acid-binding protein